MTGKNKSNLQEETKEQCFRRIRKYKDGLYYHSSQTVHDVNFLLCEVDSLRTLLAEKEKELAENKRLVIAAARVERYLATQYRLKSLSEASMQMWSDLKDALQSPAAPEQTEKQ